MIRLGLILATAAIVSSYPYWGRVYRPISLFDFRDYWRTMRHGNNYGVPTTMSPYDDFIESQVQRMNKRKKELFWQRVQNRARRPVYNNHHDYSGDGDNDE